MDGAEVYGMTQRVWLKGLAGVAALLLSSWGGAQVVGSVNGCAAAARAFYSDAGVAFARRDVRLAGPSQAELSQGISFSTTTNLQKLAELGVVAANWEQQFPHDAAPTLSTVVFLVRQGDPRAVRDWSDLVRQDVGVVIANPKSCNNGRYAYMGAWGSVRENGGSDAQAADFVGTLYRQAAVVAKVEREAVNAFARAGMGDVLVAFESDVPAIEQVAGGALEVVYPSVSVAAENTVAMAAHVAGTALPGVTRAWLEYLYTDEAQEIAARHHLRPRSAAVLARHADPFKPIEMFGVAKYFGSLERAQKLHFANGGEFDRIYRLTPAQLAAGEQVRAAF